MYLLQFCRKFSLFLSLLACTKWSSTRKNFLDLIFFLLSSTNKFASQNSSTSLTLHLTNFCNAYFQKTSGLVSVVFLLNYKVGFNNCKLLCISIINFKIFFDDYSCIMIFLMNHFIGDFHKFDVMFNVIWEKHKMLCPDYVFNSSN